MNRKQPLESWLTQQGFISNPFASKEADFEAASDPERFSEPYFVNEYWFGLIAGDWNQPRPAVLHAARGAGKSATRLALEYECRENLLAGVVLAVSYLDFEEALASNDTRIIRNIHLKALIRQITLGIFESVRRHPLLLVQNLRESYYSFLAEILGSYTSVFDQITLEKLLMPLYLPGLNSQTLLTALKNDNEQTFLSSFVLGTNFHWLKLLISAWQYQQTTLSPSPAILQKLFEVSQQLGYSAIYVLLDRIDELPETAANPEVAARIILPLITDLQLIEMPGYGFKFFLPTQVFDELKQNSGVRLDRINHVEIRWTPTLLRRFLVNRLRTYSQGRISSLGPLCDESLSESIDQRLVELAQNSPRNLLRLAELLINKHVEAGSAQKLLNVSSLESAAYIFAQELKQDKNIAPPETALSTLEVSHARPGESGIRLDMARRTVWIDGHELNHQPVGLELDLLEYLYLRAGRVVNKEELIRAVYGSNSLEVEDQRLAKLVQRVREKIEPPNQDKGPGNRRHWKYIITVPKEGYMLENRAGS